MFNTFSVQIDIDPRLEVLVKQKLNLSGEKVFGSDLDIHVVKMSTPEFNNQGIESFVANKWRIHNGYDQLYRFTMTFRDHENLALYKRFYEIYEESKHNYFDIVSFKITLRKEADWHGQSDEPFFEYEGTMIEALGSVTFDNTNESQVVEFDVNFKCVSPNRL